MNIDEIDFLIIGATKSATTWLQRSLQVDPEIFMPDPEVHYFSREFANGVDWYLSQFAKRSASHRLAGEKSNSYLEDAHSAKRIRSLLPNVKLIVQIRNPIDRAYSDYCMLYRRGAVGDDIDRHLDPRHAENTRFLKGGLYSSLLERYVDIFPPSQIQLTFYENIKHSPSEHLAAVRRFLRIDPYAYPPRPDKIKDKSQAAVDPHIRRLLSPLKPFVGTLRTTSAFRSLRSFVAREPNYPPLTTSLRARLAEYYVSDVKELGKILGRDLLPWLHDPDLPSVAPISM